LRVYFGEEDFLVAQAVGKSKKEFIEKNPQALVEIFDGGESPVKDFLHSLNAGFGLFVTKKMVVLKNVFDYDKTSQEKILEFLKKDFGFDGELELIFSWAGKGKNSKLFNFLKKKAEIKEFKKINSAEAEKFVLEKIGNQAKIEREALSKLVMIFNSNLWLLDRESEKLVNLKAGGTITQEDVDEMCDGNVNAKIFDLVDAIGNKNKARAFELLNSLLKQGEDEFYILSMMIFQIRNLSLVLDCKEKGIFNFGEIAKRTGLHPYVVQKTANQLNRFDGDQIKKIYNEAFSLDINSKSGKINIKEALEDFLIKI